MAALWPHIELPVALTSREHRRALRESVTVSLAALALVGAAIIGLWAASIDSIRQNFRHHLITLAESAATLVDPQLHQAIRRPEQLNDATYQNAVAPLRRLKAAVPEIHYLYTMVRDGSDAHFVLDAADPRAVNRDGLPEQSGVWELYPQRDATMIAALGLGGAPARATANNEPTSDAWGSFMTGWAPLHDAEGRTIGAIGVDVDAGDYISLIDTARNRALTGLIPAGALILVLGVAFYYIRLKGLLAISVASESVRRMRQEREKFDALIEGAAVGTWDIDVPSDRITVSELGASMIGLSHEQFSRVTPEQWRQRVHPDDLKLAQAAREAALREPAGIYGVDLRMRHEAGHWVWVQLRGKVLERDAQGQALRMAGIKADISDRKAAERALQDSESTFRSLFEFAPVGIALSDLETGRLLRVNEAFTAQTGFSPDELVGRTTEDLTVGGGDGAESRASAIQRNGRFGPYERICIRKDGSRYPVLWSGFRTTDTSGRDVVWSIVQDISLRKAMESELAAAAKRDKLTNVANRAFFMERLSASIARVRSGRQSMFAVLFLDFDRFKLINDTLGHRAGDELLRQTSQRLVSALRTTDSLDASEIGNLIGRVGGDEFLILLNDLKTAADANIIAERLLNALAQPYNIFGRDVHSTASVGIVTSEQAFGDADEVVRNADVAMYEAKHAGRACSVVFNEAMHTRLSRHLTIETALRKAIGTEQLSLVYQPIIALDSGRMVSAEALLRWQHPILGALSPSEFIPIAEDSGLIVPLGQWVQREACQAFAQWRRQDPQWAPPTISVNLSRAELALGQRLIEQLRELLEELQLPPQCLQLEVTEREVMRNPASSQQLLHAIRALGIQLAMDDFGTGTSSLAFLRDYPFKTIKIDRSFVSELTLSKQGMALIHATISLVQNLGKISVAEGVEDGQQAAVLQSLGCHWAQGYYFSRPVAPEQLIEAGRREATWRGRAALISTTDDRPEAIAS